MTAEEYFDPASLTRNFRTKVTVCDCGCSGGSGGTPCWLFSATDRYGYAQFTIRAKKVLGHRYAYEQLVGEIPDDHDLDHTCDRHRNCVNPAHLEPVLKAENARRANDRRWHGSEVENQRKKEREES